jgi:IclR family acetate operon transcriptional repressor
MEKDLTGRIQSVDRAMAVLETLGREAGGCRLTDLARKTALSLTTTHRLLTTLQQRRFVQFSRSDNLWHIGLGAYTVGSAFFNESNVVAFAGPFLRRLRDQTRETANIGIVEGHQIVLMDQAVSRDCRGVVSAIGAKTPMTASGMGKAVLSSYPTNDVLALVKRCGLTRLTAKTLVRLEDLSAELNKIVLSGYSIDNEEHKPGLRCVAAPVYNDRREVVCAISVSGPPSRITEDRLPNLTTIVMQTAAEFSRAIGTNDA